MLASLGVIFAAAGVGTTIGAIVGAIIPHGSIFLAVLLYALGMVVFTMIMGNAFAAFPVMAAAIGVPILIQADGGNPAVIGAVGMLSGFCGTLMTPMAANFNIVPAALLELKDQNGVIRAQIPTAIPLLIANILILYFAGFPDDSSTPTLASRMARIALGHVAQEYPHKLDHVLARRRGRAVAARASPDLLRQLRLAQLRPRLVDSADACAGCSRISPRPRRSPTLARRQLHAGESRARNSPISTARSAAGSSGHTAGRGCSTSISRRRGTRKRGATSSSRWRAPSPSGLRDYLPILTYPIRVGTHFNTAFALILSLEWADAFDPALAELIRDRARSTGSAPTAIARHGSRAATSSCRRR